VTQFRYHNIERDIIIYHLNNPVQAVIVSHEVGRYFQHLQEVV